MYCLKCGTQLPDDSKFCTSCGARISAPTYSQTSITNQQTYNVNNNVDWKKKNKKREITAIVVSILATILIVFFAIVKQSIDDNQSRKDMNFYSAYVKVMKGEDLQTVLDGQKAFERIVSEGYKPSKCYKDEYNELISLYRNDWGSKKITQEMLEEEAANNVALSEEEVSYDDDSSEALAIEGAKAIYAEINNTNPYAVNFENARIVEKDKYNRYIVLLEVRETNNYGGVSVEKSYILLRVEGDNYYYNLYDAYLPATDNDCSLLKSWNNWDEQP